MNQQPILETPRLILRPLCLKDALVVQQLAGAREIAATTLNIPHPYEDGVAEDFIIGLEAAWEQGRGATFGITRRDTGALVGCISLGVKKQFRHAEMGYWIGVPFWKRGYATEAGCAVLGFGFETLRLHRIYACHLEGNEASGRVQEKIGMKYEGCLRDHYFRNGEFYDAHFRGILASDWKSTD